MNSSTLRTLALATMLLGLTTTSALAQHHSGGGGGGGGHSSGGYHGGGSSYHGGGSYHQSGGNYHSGYGGYGSFGLYLSLPYSSGAYYGYSMSPYLYNPNPVPNYYPQPSDTPPQASMMPASIVVVVPADALVWFDGTLTRTTGESRTFDTPPLSPDRVYHYTVRALWNNKGEAVERTQRIDFQAGRQTVVDLTQPQR